MTSTSVSPGRSEVVFLPGWGFDGRVIGLRGDGLASCLAPDGLLDPPALTADFAGWLDRQGIEQCEILGWSLGGRCALELARLYPRRVAAIHLLAVRASWPAGEIAAIRRELARQPEDFLRSFYRKCFLGYKESYRRFQQEQEPLCLEQARRNPELLDRGLAQLAAPMPGPGELPPTCRVYCCHGRRDLIAPVDQRLRWPGASERVLEHGGHAIFLDYPPPPTETAPKSTDHPCNNGDNPNNDQEHWSHTPIVTTSHKNDNPVNDQGSKQVSGHRVPQVVVSGTAKRTSVREPARSPQDAVPCDRLQRIRRRFSRAAATYDDYADIQGRALELLVRRLEPDPAATAVLELGCGTGNWTRRLLANFPRARIIALDFSEPMLHRVREKCLNSPRLELLCQEGENFLAANRGRFDLITANATLQWFADLPGALARIETGLRPGGMLLTTIFGRQTLAELEAGLQEVMGGRVHVAASNFVDYPDLQAMVTAVFPGAEISEHRLRRRFDDLGQLLGHFRRTGTGGPGGTVTFSPRHYRELSRWFARQPHGFEVSFQVFVVKCKKGPDSGHH